MDDTPRSDETIDDIKASQRHEALKQKEALEDLTVHPGWKILCEWMADQVIARTDEIILKPCTGMKAQLEAEFSKGEIAMLRTIPQVIKTGLETASEVVRSLEDVDNSTAVPHTVTTDDADDADAGSA